MKSETPMCRYELRSSSSRCVGVRLVIAFALGWLTQYAIANRCLAEGRADPSTDSQLVATMPEAGAPPAPAAAVEAPASTPAPPAELPANSDRAAGAEPAETPAEVEAAQAQPSSEPSATPSPSTQSPSIPQTSSTPQTEVEVRELSVAPESKPLLPEGRPAWVGAAPDLSNPRRHRLFVGSFPTSRADETDAALDEPLEAAVNGYIDEQVLEDGDAEDLHITAAFIRHNLLDRSTEYLAELSTSSGPLYQKWVVLEITPEHRQHFTDAYRHVEQKKRMVALGLGLAGLLGITGVAHLAFNRRRRRYADPVQPVVHTVLHEPDADAAKRTSHVLWIIAGCVGCLALLGLLLIGGATITHRARTTHPMSANAAPEVIIHGEPPMPPVPPRAPEVHFDHAEMESMMQEHRAAAERLREAQATVEAQQRIIEIRSDHD